MTNRKPTRRRPRYRRAPTLPGETRCPVMAALPPRIRAAVEMDAAFHNTRPSWIVASVLSTYYRLPTPKAWD